MTNRSGQQLGHYTLLQLLGAGGFAEVYLGEHIYLKRKAAIKVLHTTLAEDNIAPFLTEARTIANLEHPHIVRVLDFGVEQHVPYLVMDYAPGGTLRRRHPQGSCLPLSLVVSYVRQVAEALQYAHDERLIHRDIKPENMLVDRQQQIVLSDFGIALMSQSSRSHTAQEIAGTAAYMAPEQFQGNARRASDQYALAVVIYEWLCGSRPFSGSFTEIASQHLFTPPRPLREKLPDLPSEIEQVIWTALAKDPERRFGTIRAFATALEEASKGGAANRMEPTISPSGQLSATREASLKPTNETQPATPFALFQPTAVPPTLAASPVQGRDILPSLTTPVAPFLGFGPLPHTEQPGGKRVRQHGLSRRVLLGSMIGGTLGIAALAGGVSWLLRPPANLLSTHNNGGGTSGIAWSPDGKYIVSSDSMYKVDQTVQVWDTTTGTTIFTYTDHKTNVEAVAWSPGGKRIASADKTTIQVWDATTGGNVLTYANGLYSQNGLTWSPDSRYIASAGWDKIFVTVNGDSISSQPDSGASWAVWVWDAASGNTILSYDKPKGPGSTAGAVTWSPDGRHIASGGNPDTVNIVNVCDATTGALVMQYKKHTEMIEVVAWSPNSKYIASGSRGSTHVWDATIGATIFSSGKGTETLAWSPDGKRIVSGSIFSNEVQVWDAATGKNVTTYTGDSQLGYVAWSPDGKRLALGWQDSVQIWQV